MRRVISVLRANLHEAVRGLIGARLRTIMGVTAIAIGIASVITMISAGEVAKARSRKQFEALGTDILSIEPRDGAASTAGGENGIIGLEDALSLADALPSLSEAAPQIELQGSFSYAGKSVGAGLMHGVSAAFSSVNALRVARGRFVSDMDTERKFVVVGADVASAMRRLGSGELVGELLEVNGHLFTVVGELADTPDSYGMPFRLYANQSVFVPVTTAKRLEPRAEITLIVARAAPGSRHADFAHAVQTYFARRVRGISLDVLSAEQLIKQMESQLGLMTLLLGAIGSVSLIVGGIGVMNVMLLSVTERRSEIGLRRALGATRANIRNQFLTESVILALAGGAVGLGIGTAATYGLCRYLGWEYLLSQNAIVAGVGVACVVGVFFGFQPAYQASRLDPIVALQSR